MKRFQHLIHALLITLFIAVPVSASTKPLGLSTSLLPGPLADLQHHLALAILHSSWNAAIDVKDLATGFESGVNVNKSMPAASTIKIPVMVEVFRQMELGTTTLHQKIHVRESDKDYGSGDLCDAAGGTPVTVEYLLWAMITDSDNTATNMLIRLVGRTHINATMSQLGLRQTSLHDYIRTDSGTIRYALRTSPHDMIRLLEAMAHHTLIDRWSSEEMLAILTGQHHNSLLPEPLPQGTQIAHKTGTLHDTLNDVGIVYLADEPYAIAVLTTNLPNLETGRAFIRHVSLLAYDSFKHLQRWRVNKHLPAFVGRGTIVVSATEPQALAPDVAMWDSHPGNVAAPDEGKGKGAGIWHNATFVP
jgi:beta-lactamase class A